MRGGKSNRGVGQWLVAGAAFAFPVSAHAQSVIPTRDELTRDQAPREAPRASLNVVGGIERSPCPLAADQFKDIQVTLTSVVFDHLKGASPDDLRPAWEPYAGKAEPVAILCEVRDAAATILRNKGYLAAVQVPTQRIENGVVHMETLFARVTTVRARGQTDGAEAKLAGYLSKLTEDEIFDRNRAERYLLLARDLPGYNVQLTLRPAGTAPGDLIGEVSVVRRPYIIDATVQNLAAKSTGRWGGQLRAQLFGLTGLGDVTTASLYSTFQTREQQILQLSHSFRPGSEGLVIDGLFTYAWTTPDLNAAAIVPDLKAKTLFASLGARYPLVRTQARNVWVGGGLDYLDQKVNFFGPQSRDRLRVGFLRASWDTVDLKSRRPHYRAGATVELRHGFAIFNASKRCPNAICPVGGLSPSHSDGDPTATLVRASGDAELAIGRNLALVVQPRVQLAFNPLLAFEEYTAGNYTIGRGYDPAIITGDSGAGASVELRGPRIAPGKRSTSFQPYGFGDGAWVWNKGVHGSQHVTSVGAGARIEFAGRFNVDAALAVPLNRAGPLNRKGGARFLLTLSTRILPWR